MGWGTRGLTSSDECSWTASVSCYSGMSWMDTLFRAYHPSTQTRSFVGSELTDKKLAIQIPPKIVHLCLLFNSKGPSLLPLLWRWGNKLHFRVGRWFCGALPLVASSFCDDGCGRSGSLSDGILAAHRRVGRRPRKSRCWWFVHGSNNTSVTSRHNNLWETFSSRHPFRIASHSRFYYLHCTVSCGYPTEAALRKLDLNTFYLSLEVT